MRNRNPCFLKPLGLSTFYSSTPLWWNSSFSHVPFLLLPLLSSSKQVEFAVGRKQSILCFVVRGIQTHSCLGKFGNPITLTMFSITDIRVENGIPFSGALQSLSNLPSIYSIHKMLLTPSPDGSQSPYPVSSVLYYWKCYLTLSSLQLILFIVNGS